MKKTYIIPAIEVTQIIGLENIMDVSGPQIGDGDANQDDGMDVKSERGTYNVWDVEW